MAEEIKKGKGFKGKDVAIIAGIGIATLIVIMYIKKCYVVINNKRYGFNPNTNQQQQTTTPAA